jgi:hypothetical protein
MACDDEGIVLVGDRLGPEFTRIGIGNISLSEIKFDLTI